MAHWELALPATWLLGTAWSDFRQRRVPNWLALTGAGLALLVLALQIQPLDLTWSNALLAGAVAFTVLLGFYALHLMGAGDVKFAGALGLWVGTHALLPIWIGASVLAMLHAGWLLLRRRTRATQCATARCRQIPYAGYMALVALAWLIGAVAL